MASNTLTLVLFITTLIGLCSLHGTSGADQGLVDETRGALQRSSAASDKVKGVNVLSTSQRSNTTQRINGQRRSKLPGNRGNSSSSRQQSTTRSCPIQFVVDLAMYEDARSHGRLNTTMFWKVSNITSYTLEKCNDIYQFQNGRLSISNSQPAFYYVYGQITYRNSPQQISGFALQANDENICKCVAQNTQNSNQTTTCSTGSVVLLPTGLRHVSVLNTERFFREMATSHEATFWGVYRMN